MKILIVDDSLTQRLALASLLGDSAFAARPSDRPMTASMSARRVWRSTTHEAPCSRSALFDVC